MSRILLRIFCRILFAAALLLGTIAGWSGAVGAADFMAATALAANSIAKKKAAPIRRPPEKVVAPAITALGSQDTASKSVQQLQELILAARQVIKVNPRDETARQNLGWISIEAANRILDQESVDTAESGMYAALVRNHLHDTFWRVSQLIKHDPARAGATLGLYFSEGILVQQDAERGCKHFVQAGELGHAAASYRAYLCRLASDPRQARQSLERAAQSGHAVAQELMGRACIEKQPVDAQCAKRWLEPAAVGGRLSAMSVLAWLYSQEAAETSHSRAAQLYEQAAAAGDPAAQSNFGELYETGRGVARDLAQARLWYRRSAVQGFGPGQFNLARMLGFGTGGARDVEASREWAIKARDQGIAQAEELLKLLQQVEKDP